MGTEQARANGYALPIVMTSANMFEPCEEAELKQRGVTCFLHKMAVLGPHHAMKKLSVMKAKPRGLNQDQRRTRKRIRSIQNSDDSSKLLMKKCRTSVE